MSYRKHKRSTRGIGVEVGATCPIAPNVIWALDFQFDWTSDGRILKLLNVIDEYSRECLAIVVERSIDADGVVACLALIHRKIGRSWGQDRPSIREKCLPVRENGGCETNPCPLRKALFRCAHLRTARTGFR